MADEKHSDGGQQDAKQSANGGRMTPKVKQADVAHSFMMCASAFDQLREALKVIQEGVDNPERIKNISETYIYLAETYSDMADSWRDEVVKRGVEPLAQGEPA